MSKKIIQLLTLFILLSSFVVFLNESDLVWDKKIHNFGTISQDIEVETEFSCINNSDQKFLIESVKGSCGCVVSSWTKDSIAKNGKAIIKVKFNPGKKTGNHLKYATVYSNFGAIDLTIIADVTNNE